MENFEQAKKRYDSITPIRQIKDTPLRKCQVGPDVRPLQRIGWGSQYRDRIVKISENEYSIVSNYMYGPTQNTYNNTLTPQQYLERQRLVSFKRNGEVVVYRDAGWRDKPHTHYQWTTRRFLNWQLPRNLEIVGSIGGKTYLKVHGEYYKIPDKGLRLKDTGMQWTVLNPEPESTYRVDRKVAKKVRNKIAGFRKLMELYWHMMDGEYDGRYQLSSQLNTISSTIIDVMEGKEGEENRINLVRAFKHRYTKDMANGYWQGVTSWNPVRRWRSYQDYRLPKEGKDPVEYYLNQIDRPLLKRYKHMFKRSTVPLGCKQRKHWLEA